VCIGYNLDTAHFTFSEKRINYYNNVVVVGKSIQKKIITMITKTDHTIDSDVCLGERKRFQNEFNGTIFR
jgi:hypothetical protein